MGKVNDILFYKVPKENIDCYAWHAITSYADRECSYETFSKDTSLGAARFQDERVTPYKVLYGPCRVEIGRFIINDVSNIKNKLFTISGIIIYPDFRNKGALTEILNYSLESYGVVQIYTSSKIVIGVLEKHPSFELTTSSEDRNGSQEHLYMGKLRSE